MPSEVRATKCSRELACSKPNTRKPRSAHDTTYNFAADSKRGLATEWQHFACVQVVLHALVRCAPILAREGLTCSRGHERSQPPSPQKNCVAQRPSR